MINNQVPGMFEDAELERSTSYLQEEWKPGRLQATIVLRNSGIAAQTMK